LKIAAPLFNAANWAVTQRLAPVARRPAPMPEPMPVSSAFAFHLAAVRGPLCDLSSRRCRHGAVPLTPFSFFAKLSQAVAGAAPQWDIQWFNPAFVSEAGFHGYTPGNNAYSPIHQYRHCSRQRHHGTIISTPPALPQPISRQTSSRRWSPFFRRGSAQTNVVAATAQSASGQWVPPGTNFQSNRNQSPSPANTAWSASAAWLLVMVV